MSLGGKLLCGYLGGGRFLPLPITVDRIARLPSGGHEYLAAIKIIYKVWLAVVGWDRDCMNIRRFSVTDLEGSKICGTDHHC